MILIQSTLRPIIVLCWMLQYGIAKIMLAASYLLFDRNHWKFHSSLDKWSGQIPAMETSSG